MKKFFVFMFSEKFRLVLSIFLVFVSIFLFGFSAIKNDKLYIPYFHSKFQKVCFNIELQKEYKDKVSFVINGEENPVVAGKYLQEECWVLVEDENNINSLFLSYPFAIKNFGVKILGTKTEVENVINNINSMIIFVGKKMYVFDKNDVQKFKITYNTGYSTISPPLEKTILNSYNKLLLNNFVINFLSIFYLWQNYLAQWILLLLGIVVFPRLKVKVRSGVVFGIIFLLSFLLRYNKLDNYPLFFDEINLIYWLGGNYTSGLRGLFADWGNPPLINTIYQLITRISLDAIAFRTVFVVIGTIGTFAIYLLGKNRITKKVGLISAFAYAVSILAISYSQLCRSYIISFVLGLVFVYFMFNYFDENKPKNIVGMIVSGTLLINNHLFGGVFLLLNFLYGICLLCKKHDFSKIKNLIISFLVICFSFLPYFYFMVKRGLFGKYFYSWIGNHPLSDVVAFYFGHVSFALLIGAVAVCCVFFRKKLFPHFEEKQNEFLNYLIFFIPMFTLGIYLISLWKSCFIESYFLIVYGFLIILVSTFSEIKCKLLPWLVIFSFICLQSANTSPLYIHTYRDVYGILNLEAQKQKSVYFFSTDFSVRYGENSNILSIPDGIYYNLSGQL